MTTKKRSIYLAFSKKLREKNMSEVHLIFGPQAIGRKTILLMPVILWEHIMLLSGGQSLFLVHLSIFCTENTENSHLMSNISWNIYLIATLNHLSKLKLYSHSLYLPCYVLIKIIFWKKLMATLTEELRVHCQVVIEKPEQNSSLTGTNVHQNHPCQHRPREL